MSTNRNRRFTDSPCYIPKTPICSLRSFCHCNTSDLKPFLQPHIIYFNTLDIKKLWGATLQDLSCKRKSPKLFLCTVWHQYVSLDGGNKRRGKFLLVFTLVNRLLMHSIYWACKKLCSKCPAVNNVKNPRLCPFWTTFCSQKERRDIEISVYFYVYLYISDS